jgi:hypothetical protein
MRSCCGGPLLPWVFCCQLIEDIAKSEASAHCLRSRSVCHWHIARRCAHSRPMTSLRENGYLNQRQALISRDNGWAARGASLHRRALHTPT